MNEKRYQVIYTGKLKPGLDTDTVRSNLVLSLGISEVKAKRLLECSTVVLKRCSSSVEAQVLVEKFDQAGVVCAVRSGSGGVAAANPGAEAGGESSLVRMLRQFSPTSESPSLFKRLIGGGQRRRRA